MRITLMESAHVSQVAQLEKLCFSAPWSENSISSELTNPLSCWLVALDGDRVAGYVGSQTVLDESDMMNIAVDPQYRRQGIAQALVEELVKCLARKGSRCLTLEVRASNAGAIALYGKLGFVQVGLRKNYYRNPREDAMILRKEWTV
jgi:ribosomal-protein-alanine N-acetyltransferase